MNDLMSCLKLLNLFNITQNTLPIKTIQSFDTIFIIKNCDKRFLLKWSAFEEMHFL